MYCVSSIPLRAHLMLLVTISGQDYVRYRPLEVVTAVEVGHFFVENFAEAGMNQIFHLYKLDPN